MIKRQPDLYGALSFYVLALLAGLSSLACSTHDLSKGSWITQFTTVGSYSSPRVADLNQDGVLDIILGAGKSEFEPSDTAVIALDGQDGSILWTADATDQMVGSATLLDIDQDGILDVIIGGRGANLKALRGTDGMELWTYHTQDTVINPHGYARFNFYNTQVVPDQDGDGIPDLLASNGGNVHAPPSSDKLRYPGVLMIISSGDGSVIAADIVPDGKETYMSPLVCDFDLDGNLDILFGTGGETRPGNLYRVALDSLLQEDISSATVLAAGTEHGFIAPPLLVDITSDGVPDIIANYHGGITYAIDGDTHDQLWSVEMADMETSGSITPGYFTEDEIPDFFTYFCHGEWPDNTGLVWLMIDGSDGTVRYRQEADCAGMHSAVSFDSNEDGYDEVLVNFNAFNCSDPQFLKVVHHLEMIDFRKAEITEITPKMYAKNIASTPWIGDVDGDQIIDIVYCRLFNTTQLYGSTGMQVVRFASNYPMSQPPTWNTYMGNDHNGILGPRN